MVGGSPRVRRIDSHLVAAATRARQQQGRRWVTSCGRRDGALDVPSPPASLSLRDYDQSCTTNAECTLTFDGPCKDGECWCLDGAISNAAHAAYSNALFEDAQRRACSNVPGPRCLERCGQNLDSLCEDERCVVRPRRPPLDATLFDQACEAGEDCTAVYADPCRCFPCEGEAIASTAVATFEGALAQQPTCGTPASCEGQECPFGRVRCNEQNRCEFFATSGPP